MIKALYPKTPLFSRECTTALKGIAISLVIFGHRGLIDCGGQWGVHIFLFLSGYGIFKSAQKNGMAAYWRKRLVGVFVPYILFSVFKLGILLVMGEEVGVGKAFCTLMGLDFCLNVDPTMWYITYIFVCYAVFYAAWPLYRRCRVAAFTSTLFVSFVLIAVVGRINIAWNSGAVAWVYFWTFPAGVMLAMHEEKIAGGGISPTVYVLACVAALTAVALMYGAPHGSLNMFVYSAAGAVLVTLLVKFLMDGPAGTVLVKALSPLGNASYAMYLNEGFLIRLDGLFPFSMGPISTLVLSFIFAVAWNWLVSDRVTRWLKGMSIASRRYS
ncbi:acyltransferase family protein [Collinsella sp. LCP19S3_D2]|uniref:acyltransferase family protein n=1 Tax=unclassified Collinsella TaxID=2637548 RepID=UPI003F8FF4B7